VTRYARCDAYSANTSHVVMTERDGPTGLGPIAIPDTSAHMLRHGCGYALANAGHDTRALQAWLGHKNIQHTVRYTELALERFKDFWRS
jgi:integrase